VVDDEVDFATALEALLQKRGFVVKATFSGRAALEELRGASYDVVVLDLKMPDMDGLTTWAEVRRLDPHVQAIVLTGHGTVSSGIRGMQLGAADFLQKPTDTNTLCAVIRSAAERARESRQLEASSSVS
jgi:DNA-binding response OmpR family regulator